MQCSATGVLEIGEFFGTGGDCHICANENAYYFHPLPATRSAHRRTSSHHPTPAQPPINANAATAAPILITTSHPEARCGTWGVLPTGSHEYGAGFASQASINCGTGHGAPSDPCGAAVAWPSPDNEGADGAPMGPALGRCPGDAEPNTPHRAKASGNPRRTIYHGHRRSTRSSSRQRMSATHGSADTAFVTSLRAQEPSITSLHTGGPPGRGSESCVLMMSRVAAWPGPTQPAQPKAGVAGTCRPQRCLQIDQHTRCGEDTPPP